MYKKIVVGYDGTKFSDAALKEAIELAKDSGGTIFIVTAVTPITGTETMSPKFEELLADEAHKGLKKAAAKVGKAGIGSETSVVALETAYEGIVDFAGRKKADLIVVGTHGRTGLMRLMMGSTASRVIGHAPCSVLVVRSK